MNNISPDDLTQKMVKDLLIYNPDTGVFTNRIDRRRIKAGDLSGTLNVGYIRITINNKRCLAHRLAWLYVYGEMPISDIDHINHNRLDNRIENLRLADKVVNGKNMSKSVRNKSGVVGVSWNTREKKWKAQISINKARKTIGAFKDFFECVCARKSAENKHGYHANHGC